MNFRALLFVVVPLALATNAHAQQPIQLESIRSQTDEAKDQVRLVRERLAVMSRTLMTPSLAQTTIDMSDETTAAYKLVSARATVDGTLQFDRREIGNEKTLPIFTGGLASGSHTVKMEIVVRGNGFGVFSYLRGYQMTLTSSHTFVAAEGKPVHLTATAFEVNDVTVPFDRRPQIRWVSGDK